MLQEPLQTPPLLILGDWVSDSLALIMRASPLFYRKWQRRQGELSVERCLRTRGGQANLGTRSIVRARAAALGRAHRTSPCHHEEISSYSRTTRYPHTVERSSTAFGCLRHTLSASRLLLRRSGEWLRADICTPKGKMVSNNVDAGLRVTRRPGLLLAYFSQRGGAPYE